MATQNYTSNSHKSKKTDEPRKKMTSVVSASKVLPNTTANKAAVAANDVKEHILGQVVMPTIKRSLSDIAVNAMDMISEIIVNSVETALLGEPRTRRGRGQRVGYDRCYSGPRKADDRDTNRYGQTYARPGYDFDNIVIESRGEAEEVLSMMCEALDTYGTVSILDYYDLCNVTSEKFTDQKYGWTDLSKADVIRCMGGGYNLKLPKPVQLNK